MNATRRLSYRNGLMIARKLRLNSAMVKEFFMSSPIRFHAKRVLGSTHNTYLKYGQLANNLHGHRDIGNDKTAMRTTAMFRKAHAICGSTEELPSMNCSKPVNTFLCNRCAWIGHIFVPSYHMKIVFNFMQN